MSNELLLKNGAPKLVIDRVEWSGRTVSFHAPHGMAFMPDDTANYEIDTENYVRPIPITRAKLRGADCFFTACLRPS